MQRPRKILLCLPPNPSSEHSHLYVSSRESFQPEHSRQELGFRLVAGGTDNGEPRGGHPLVAHSQYPILRWLYRRPALTYRFEQVFGEPSRSLDSGTPSPYLPLS